MSRIRGRSVVVVSVVAALSLFTGCSTGSGSTSSGGEFGSAATKPEFCERLDALIASVGSTTPAGFTTALRELAAVAPTVDLGQAASRLADTYAVLAEVPEGDLEAFEKVLGELDEETVNGDVTTLETYGLEECGINGE